MNNSFESHGLSENNCVDTCTAPTCMKIIVDTNIGIIHKWRQWHQNYTSSHCILYCHTLAVGSGGALLLQDALEEAIKSNNPLKFQPLNT